MGIPFFITINHHWPSPGQGRCGPGDLFDDDQRLQRVGARRSTGGAHLQQFAAARPDSMGKKIGRSRCQKKTMMTYINIYIYIHGL